MTTKYQQEKQKYTDAAKNVGKSVKAGYDKAEEEADKLVAEGEGIIAKLKKSKYTAASIVGVGLLAAFLLIR